MNYPLKSEYIASIKDAENSFKELNNLRPVIGPSGKPVMRDGDFSVVFKVTDGAEEYALKCFLCEQEGRSESFRMIADELEYVSSTFLATFKYYEKELFVKSDKTSETRFPVLLMAWVDGDPLDIYVHTHIHDRFAIGMVAFQFCRMAQWLFTMPFAHGNLTPDNILVKKDGTVVLVDYDDMYVPAMKGKLKNEGTNPNYTHPLSLTTQLDEHTDEFALSVIALSLKALSLNPNLYSKYGDSDHLLMSSSDFQNLKDSGLWLDIQSLLQNSDLAQLFGLFLIAYSKQDLGTSFPRLFNIARPEKTKVEEIKINDDISAEVTDDDLANSWEDSYGVKYSKDGIRLLKAPSDLIAYSIKNGVKVICNYAFGDCESLQTITIPDTVISISCNAFKDCRSLQSIVLPSSLTSIGDSAFYGCESLESIIIPESVTSIEEYIFYGCRSLQSIVLPFCLTSIGEYAFYGCESLESITIPRSVIFIGSGVFASCEIALIIDSPNFYSDGICLYDNLQEMLICCHQRYNMEYVIPDTVVSIGDSAFSKNNYLQSIIIPESVTSIGVFAFEDCESLESIIIPESVTSIDSNVFNGCCSLQSIVLPSSLISIGSSAFEYCESLESIVIPESVTSIDSGAFAGCEIVLKIESSNFCSDGICLFDKDKENLICCHQKNVKVYAVPETVTEIYINSFRHTHIETISIPESVKFLKWSVFDLFNDIRTIIVSRNNRPKIDDLLEKLMGDKFIEI